MNRLLLFFMIFSVFSALTQERVLSASEIQSFKLRVENGTKELKSMKMDFDQDKQMAFLSTAVQSKGKMYLNEKGNLKWEYSEPNKYSIIFKDNAILIDDNGKKNTVKNGKEIFGKLSKLVVGSINGKLFNDSEFVINYFKNGEDYIVKLTPEDKMIKKYIKQVNLFFHSTEITVSKVKLIEPSGDFTLISFKNKQVNVPISTTVFNH